MAVHTIKRGLDLPIAGGPVQRIDAGQRVSRVALVADDYIGLKPTMFVQEGDAVKRGQPLFEDKKNPGVIFTAPGAGTVAAVHRGERRALVSVIIELTESERLTGDAGEADTVRFQHYTGKDPAGLSRGEIKNLLVESGLWTTLRVRPFGKVPPLNAEPGAVFVTAMDSNPHAPDPDVVIAGAEKDFERGLVCVAKLTEGPTFVCRKPGSKVPVNPNTGVRVEEFAGPHPAGTPGLHIHTLFPVNRQYTAWHLNYQDVIAIGRLFGSGALNVGRVVSLAGPRVSNPRLVSTRVGASLEELTKGELIEDGELRIVSGSVLSGRTATGPERGFLGLRHHQVSVLKEGRERHFIGWLMPGTNQFSSIPLYLSRLMPGKRFPFTTSTNGSARAMVPIGLYERVFPFDMEPTYLLREMIVGNVERAEQLGCLELDEEDLALCTFVCPGKFEYGPILRSNLSEIEKEG